MEKEMYDSVFDEEIEVRTQVEYNIAELMENELRYVLRIMVAAAVRMNDTQVLLSEAAERMKDYSYLESLGQSLDSFVLDLKEKRREMLGYSGAARKARSLIRQAMADYDKKHHPVYSLDEEGEI